MALGHSPVMGQTYTEVYNQQHNRNAYRRMDNKLKPRKALTVYQDKLVHYALAGAVLPGAQIKRYQVKQKVSAVLYVDPTGMPVDSVAFDVFTITFADTVAPIVSVDTNRFDTVLMPLYIHPYTGFLTLLNGKTMLLLGIIRNYNDLPPAEKTKIQTAMTAVRKHEMELKPAR